MASHASSKPTCNLKPGDVVVGCAEAMIMVPPEGIRVLKTEVDKRDGGIFVFWSANPDYPEKFNPYFSWFVEDKEKENKNG